MKSVNTYYTNLQVLTAFIEKEKIIDSSSLLIQVFSGLLDKDYIQNIIKELVELLPYAVIIGATTDGEVMNGKVSTQKVILSFTQFEHTSLKIATAEHKKDGYFSGQQIMKSLDKENIKLVISFSDGLHTNGEAFLDGICSVNNEVIVAGGLAGDNAEFKKTYVFTKDKLIEKGAVAVAFYSDRLLVYNDYSFDWLSIGKELTITKVKANRVYTIDDKTAVEMYGYYLGEDVALGLPSIGIEFPLVTKRNGVLTARAVVAKHDDGSLSFAGNLNLGDKVQFGYGNPTDILRHSSSFCDRISNKSSEAIFVYSCMARRHFMPELIESESLPLQVIASTSGFFTYGEFFTSTKKELLNQSMTIISLSETMQINVQKNFSKNIIETVGSSTKSLIHLLNKTSEEVMEQEILKKEQATFEILFEQSPDGILLIDGNEFIKCNQKIVDIFGYDSKKEFLSKKLYQLSVRLQPNGLHYNSALQQMKDKILKLGSHQFEWVLKKKNGENFWVELTLTTLVLNKKDILSVLCRDISDRKNLELEIEVQKEKLFYQAHHDSLTDLPNRTFFTKVLNDTIEKSSPFLLLLIDLDKFKPINDSLGHYIGNSVIKLAGERILNILDEEDVLARLGGDEFLVMIKKEHAKTHPLTKISTILVEIKKPITIEHYTFYLTTSIGISQYPKDSHLVDELFKYTDTAMYQVKENGGNNFLFYSNELTNVAYENFMMEKELRESLEREDFEVYYQPQVNLVTQKLIGFEALVRWNHPTKGFIQPDSFIPLAERTGLIVGLDLWVMKTAMKQFVTWYKEGLNPGVLALNASMQQLEYSKFLKSLKENIKVLNFKAEWLEIEITETSMMTNPKKIITILEKLHTLGIAIAIDDFGTGYSSLSHLKRLPIDKLKIDKSFIADVLKDKDASVIVNTIITLGKSLNLRVIAEGVEEKAEKDFLIIQGCHEAQGYYFSKPLNTEMAKKFLINKS